MAKFLRISGSKKSGKTRLIEELSGEFIRRGFTVAALKITSHDHDFDIPDTDTWRYRKAGCESAVIVSPGEFVCHAGGMIREKRKDFYEILYDGTDLVFVEGSGELEAPILECVGTDKKSGFSGDSKLLAIVSDHMSFSGCVIFKFGEVKRIADLVIEKLDIKKAGSDPAS